MFCVLNAKKGNLKIDINQKITEELSVKRWQVDAAVKLIDEGNTIPFIARYRKEATGTLDDEQLRKLFMLMALMFFIFVVVRPPVEYYRQYYLNQIILTI